jgi:transposase
MPAKKYRVTLIKEERKLLGGILRKGKHGAQKRKRAQALLLADDSLTDSMIAERTGMSVRGLEQLRERFAEEGFEIPLNGKGKGHRPRPIQGADEARLIALVCGPKPEGSTRWTLRLLAEQWTALAHTETRTVSYQTIRRTVQKTRLSRGGVRSGVSRRKGTPSLQRRWRLFEPYTPVNGTKNVLWFAWTNVPNS